jgi:hypothetical protein
MTVFLVVMFSTLLVAFINSASSLFFMIGQANGGDFDITINALQESEFAQEPNDNFYNDV